jgi:hypothetical protein
VNSLATFKQRQTPWARSVLGLFVVVWLNLALQPCAMAMGGDDDHDCPHCPPGHTQEHDGHDMASIEAVGHDMPCATVAADCSVLDDYNYDGRAVQLKVKDAPSDLPVALLPSEQFLADAQSNLVAYAPPNINHPPGPSLPLNILYCVYLD